MIYVTHDQIEAMTLADKIVVLRDGLIEQVGSPRELYERPGNLFVAQFIGSPKMNVLPVARRARARLGPAGAMQVGMRPEDLRIVDPDGPRSGRVVIGEYTGASSLLHVLLESGETCLVTCPAAFPRRTRPSASPPSQALCTTPAQTAPSGGPQRKLARASKAQGARPDFGSDNERASRPRPEVTRRIEKMGPHSARVWQPIVAVADAVACAADGMNERSRLPLVDLLAKVADVDVDDLRAGIEAVAPVVVEDLGAAEHAAGVLHQVAEKRVLLGGQLDGAGAAGDLAGVGVEDEVGDLEPRMVPLQLAPPQQRLDAGNELVEREWLGEVVVGAGTKPADLVAQRVLGGQHQHPGADALLTELAADLDPSMSGSMRSRIIKGYALVRASVSPRTPVSATSRT